MFKVATYTLLFLLTFIKMSPSVHAEHLTGGEMRYSYVKTLPNGSQVYMITTQIYRDALGGGADFDDPLYMTVYNLDNVSYKNRSVPLNFVNISVLPLNDLGPCSKNIPNIRIEKAIYTLYDTVKPNNFGYLYVHQRCCRPYNISNLATPGDQGSTYFTQLTPEAMSINNSSPEFTQDPPILMCVRSNFEYQFAAEDFNGNKLRYYLCQPMVGGNNLTNDGIRPYTASRPPYTPVQYINGYSYDKPFGSNVQVDLDPNTGLINFQTDKVGIYTVAVCIDELDINNQIINTTKRDIQFNVADCIVASASASIDAAQPVEGVFSTCKGQTLKFINKSSDAQTHFWDFGVIGVNNDTSTLKEPTFTFPDSGIYHVTLIINRGQTCADTSNIVIRTYPLLIPDFEYQVQCEKFPVHFYSTSTSTVDPIIKYNWNYSSTISNDSSFNYTFPSTGPYPIKLKIETEHGCLDSISKTISLQKFTEAKFNTPGIQQADTNLYVVCGSSLIASFTNLSSSASPNLWIVDGKTFTDKNLQYTFPDTGKYEIKLVVNPYTLCADTSVKWIRFLPPPIADYTYKTDCQKFPVEFFTTPNPSYNPIQSVSWNFGDGSTESILNPIKSFVSAKNYNVQLKVTTISGCTNQITKTITVNPNPVADFNIVGQNQNGQYIRCSNLLPIQFNDNSIQAQTYHWTFGNNLGTSTSKDDSFIFPDTGKYNIRLIVNRNMRCTDTSSQQIQVVNGISKVDFNLKDGCESTEQTFSNTSVAVKNDFSSYHWSFGDGTSSNIKNPKKTYSSPGSYPIQLTVETALGCKDSIVKSITIFNRPIPDFGNADICLNSSKTINNLSTIPTGSIDSYSWDLGILGTSTLTTPGVKYSAPGVFPISLSATSDKGCKAEITKSITVRNPSTVDFKYENICFKSPVSFTSLATSPYNDLAQWTWDFGDGQKGSGQRVSHNYANSGNYQVKLQVISAYGCKDSIIKTVKINPLPIADFDVEATPLDSQNYVLCKDNKKASFINKSPDDAIPQWNFGNIGSSSDKSPTFTFPDTGLYQITLTINKGTQCSNSKSLFLDILPDLKTDFDYSLPCEKNSIQFNDISTTILNNIVSREWDLDGKQFSQKNFSYTYNKFGNFPVRLIVKSSRGCEDSIVKNIRVEALPIVDFKTIDACPGQKFQIENLSKSVNNNKINSYLWKFSDDSISTSTSPNVQYPAKGEYPISLTAYTVAGCKDSISKTLTIKDNIAPIITQSIDISCIGKEIIWDASQSTGSFQTYFWDFGDGQTSHKATDTILYNSAGNYDIYLTLTDSICGKFDTSTSIEIIEIPPFDLGDDILICPNMETTISFHPQFELDSLIWSTGDVDTFQVSVPSDIGLVKVNLYYQGCEESDSLYIFPNCNVLVPKAFSPNADGVNDYFNIMPLNVESYELYVYNRWGELLFSTNNLKDGWDGTYKGQIQPMDNYTYYTVGTKINGEPFSLKGTILLLR